MARYLYTNNAASTLLGNVGPTDTSISLPGGNGGRFPSPVAANGETFLLTIEDTAGNIEVVECTGRTADILTVVRGREGTLARAWTATTPIDMRITAGMLGQIDWTAHANVANGVAVLDGTAKLPITTFDTPVQVYGDNRWNVKLGYTPVQQGTGVGQATNVVKIGWSAGSKLKATIDATDYGNIALETWVTGGFLPSTYVPTWASITGKPATFPPTLPINISDVSNLQNTLNGMPVNNATNNANITWTGTVTAGAIVGGSVTDNSDSRIKDHIEPMTVDDAWRIICGTDGFRFFNTLTQRDDFGVIADNQLEVTPELVFEGKDPRRLLSFGYSRLTVPLCIALADLRKRGVI